MTEESNISKLWKIIGEYGSNLTTLEKQQMVMIILLSIPENIKHIHGDFTIHLTLGDIVSNLLSEDNIQLYKYNGCGINGNEILFSKVFDFKLTKKECWEAISKIATKEY